MKNETPPSPNLRAEDEINRYTASCPTCWTNYCSVSVKHREARAMIKKSRMCPHCITHVPNEEPEMKEYCVTWGIELDAESPEDAAQKALAMLRDPNSQATIFQVEREDYPAVNIYLLEIK